MTLLQAITVGKNPKKSALFAGNAKLNVFGFGVARMGACGVKKFFSKNDEFSF